MLDDHIIQGLKAADKPKKYADGGGLFLFIPASGKKLWRLAYRFERKAKLLSFQEVFTDVPVHVYRNLYFGEARRFDLYNFSNARETVEKNGSTLDFPAVGNRVADWLYSRRMSIRAAHPEMPFSTRAELQHWRALCAKMFESVMGEAS